MSKQKKISHSIAQNQINPNALKVLSVLHAAGYDAYLVGGCVRDLLLGHIPKDFDVATNALPEQIRKLFRTCRLIGRRFRLAHIYFGHSFIEVATFRGAATEEEGKPHQSQHGLLLRDNTYGSLEDDACRRDFTINALYYNYADSSILDYVDSLEDIKQGVIRLIGDPAQRYREDPVRMLRAIRFAAKLNLAIHPGTAKPIFEFKELLQHVSHARMYDEVLKLFLGGKSLKTFDLLREYRMFSYLFSQTDALLNSLENPHLEPLLRNMFINTDKRISEGKSVNPAFIIASLLWYPLQRMILELEQEGKKRAPATEIAMRDVLALQTKQTVISRRLALIVQEIWALQSRLSRRSGKQAYRLLNLPRFRAAYDFLLLRESAGEDLGGLGEWWTQFQEGSDATRAKLIANLKTTRKKAREKYIYPKNPRKKQPKE